MTCGDTWPSGLRSTARLAGSSVDKPLGLERSEQVLGLLPSFLAFTLSLHLPTTLPEPWDHIPQGGDAGQVLNALDLVLQEEAKVGKPS